MKNILFIANPISGTHGKTSIFQMINERIDRDKYSWNIVNTKCQGDAVELAADAVKKHIDMVVAIGGDGTINEVARSLVNTDTAIGVIPCGSGNGLARHLEIPLNVSRAIDILNEGFVDMIDYGTINDKAFFCTCGVGFDAIISLKFAAAGKRGPLTYVEQTLREWLSYKPETYELETEDGVKIYEAFLIACGNASQYGNNAFITPKAKLSDGLLDVTVLKKFSVFDVPSLAFQLFNKTIDHNSCIKTFQCSKLSIHRSKPGVVHFDGDPMIMDKDINIELKRSGLKVIVSKKFNEEKQKDDSIVLQRINSFFEGIKDVNKGIMNTFSSTSKKKEGNN